MITNDRNNEFNATKKYQPAHKTMDVNKVIQGGALEKIYKWIHRLPLSRPIKNIPHDFSDAVLMAELAKFHYPRFVEVHNYVPVNGVAAKIDNWKMLDRKVLSKINLRLGKDRIVKLANAKIGVIDKLLMDFHSKVMNDFPSELKKEQNNAAKSHEDEMIEYTALKTESSENTEHVGGIFQESSSQDTKNGLNKAADWLAGWIWPFSKNLTVNSAADDDRNGSAPGSDHETHAINSAVMVEAIEDEISPNAYLQLKRELQEKSVTMNMLNRKISHLTEVVKLKDEKIIDLSARVLNSRVSQGRRLPVMCYSTSRFKTKTKSYNS